MGGTNPILKEFHPRKADFGFSTYVNSENLLKLGRFFAEILRPNDEGDYFVEYNTNYSSSEFKIYINSHLLRDRIANAISAEGVI